MENNINAWCSICGNGYHVCNSCLEQKTFRPWRAVTDTVEHFLIYSVLHTYTLTKNKKLARKELEKCDLSELENFNSEIKTVIHEIMDNEIDSKQIQIKKDNIVTENINKKDKLKNANRNV